MVHLTFRRITFWGLLLVSLLASRTALVAQEEPTGEWIRVAYASQEALGELAAWLDIWEVDQATQTALIYATPEQIARLQSLGYTLQTVASSNRATVDTVPGYPCYHTVTEMNAMLQQWASAYPHLTERLEIGHSYEGRPLYVLRITNEATGLNKPILFVMAGVHGREMITPEVALAFIETLLTGYGVNPDITWLLDHQRVDVVVSVNPDGHVKNEPGYPWAWWRKNTNPQGCQYSNYYGVDLNRNYPFRWSAAGVSGPCDSTYPGTAPLSEPETQAIVTYITGIFPVYAKPGQGQVAPLTTQHLFIDMHSYGNLVLWPWGDVPTAPPNSAAMTALGSKLAAITGYRASQSYQGLYPTSGTADDWVYAEFGIPGYTIEVGNGDDSFYPPCTRRDALVQPNVAMLLYAAKVARQPYQMAYGPDVTALELLNVMPLTGVEPLRLQAMIDDAQTGGRPISAAEAYIDTPPWAGGTPYPLAAADGTFNSARETVTAQLPTVGLTTGRHLVLVRGRDNSGAWGPLTAAFFTVAADGTVNGVVSARDGTPLPDVAVSLTNGSTTRTATTDAQGRFSFTLRAGTYTLRASAWGYYPLETTLTVLAQKTISVALTMIPQPRGWVQATVQEVGSARPLTATVNVSGTPWSGSAAPTLTLHLPLGTYTLRAQTEGYASREETVTVTPGQTSTVRLRMRPLLPPLLLVSAGTPSTAEALASMGYPMATWDLNTRGAPDAAALFPYPAIAWLSGEAVLSNEAQAALQAYLAAGGHLFVSGSRLGDTAFYREGLGLYPTGVLSGPVIITGTGALAGLTAFLGEGDTAEALAVPSAAGVLARYEEGSAAVLYTDRVLVSGFDMGELPVETQRLWLMRLLPLLDAWPAARLEAGLTPRVSAFIEGHPVTYHLTLVNDSLWQIRDLAVTVTVPAQVVVSGGTPLTWSALPVQADGETTLTWSAWIPPTWEVISWDVEARWSGVPEPVRFRFLSPVRLIVPQVWLPLVGRAAP